jgi:hypothetical protein
MAKNLATLTLRVSHSSLERVCRKQGVFLMHVIFTKPRGFCAGVEREFGAATQGMGGDEEHVHFALPHILTEKGEK